MKDLDINFPLEKFEKLIIDIGWESLDDWFNFWNNKRNILSIDQYWNNKVNDDWIWGLALPLLSQAYKLQNNFSDRKIIGISALPGTGKTTLGKWLEAISLKLNFKIAVISIDDFYLPSNEMKLAIKNNPWNVSRGFPGSHSVKLMHEKLLNWKINGELNVRVFDKSLRNGLGDRSHWRLDNPDLLILEGWFLGIKPHPIQINDSSINRINLSFQESSYIKIILRSFRIERVCMTTIILICHTTICFHNNMVTYKCSCSQHRFYMWIIFKIIFSFTPTHKVIKLFICFCIIKCVSRHHTFSFINFLLLFCSNSFNSTSSLFLSRTL